MIRMYVPLREPDFIGERIKSDVISVRTREDLIYSKHSVLFTSFMKSKCIRRYTILPDNNI